MKTQYHILNGDTLKTQFPEQIPGETFVMRECLVDGSVQADDLELFFDLRSKFISNAYQGCSEEEYYQQSVSEFKNIQKIPLGNEINLWFEEDLFCQVNFWFIVNLLNTNHSTSLIYLIKPKAGCEYSFGGMDEIDLITAFQNKTIIELSEIQKISELWKLYQINDCERMLDIAKELESKFPFLTPAISAHVDRIPKPGNPGRPAKSLICIMDELQTKEFKPVFHEFCKREPIYGFGDLQVRRMMDEIG